MLIERILCMEYDTKFPKIYPERVFEYHIVNSFKQDEVLEVMKIILEGPSNQHFTMSYILQKGLFKNINCLNDVTFKFTEEQIIVEEFDRP